MQTIRRFSSLLLFYFRLCEAQEACANTAVEHYTFVYITIERNAVTKGALAKFLLNIL